MPFLNKIGIEESSFPKSWSRQQQSRLFFFVFIGGYIWVNGEKFLDCSLNLELTAESHTMLETIAILLESCINNYAVLHASI